MKAGATSQGVAPASVSRRDFCSAAVAGLLDNNNQTSGEAAGELGHHGSRVRPRFVRCREAATCAIEHAIAQAACAQAHGRA
jgi:hypothetical protein